jgi:hypothetical protein
MAHDENLHSGSPAADPGPDREQPRPSGSHEDGGRRRILHARISDELHEALSRAAKELRVPVSNLVRNVLEDAFTLGRRAAVNVTDLVGRAVKEAEEVGTRLRQRVRAADAAEPTSDPFARVAAWQLVILNAPQTCARCAAPLARQSRAYCSVGTHPRDLLWLCEPCLPREPR